jgi:hypothetical protein
LTLPAFGIQMQQQPDYPLTLDGDVVNAAPAFQAPDGYGILCYTWSAFYDNGFLPMSPGEGQLQFTGGANPPQDRAEGPYPSKLTLNFWGPTPGDFSYGSLRVWLYFVPAQALETTPSVANFTAGATNAITFDSDSATNSAAVHTLADGSNLTSVTPLPTLSVVETLASGVTFTDNEDGTATLAGDMPAAGNYSLTIQSINSVGEVDQALTLTIT